MGQLVRPDKVTTFRCPAALGDQLDAIARVDETTVSEILRRAIEEHIAKRRADGAFQTRLKMLIAHDRAVLDKLAPDARQQTARDAAVAVEEEA
jgi:uncharacterized membrane-anchored protein YjiN (DUF445 family)